MNKEAISSAITIIRKLPPIPGGIFHSAKCPKIDDHQEDALGLFASGIRKLLTEDDRNQAVRQNIQVLAVTKRELPPFRMEVAKVCEEDGHVWNYLLFGSVSILDGAKLIQTFLETNKQSLLSNGIDTHRLFSYIESILGPSIRDEIAQTRQDFKYHIADIEKKDVCPVLFWNRMLNEKLAGTGLHLEISETTFCSPDAELEQQQLKAKEAERKLLEQERREFQHELEKVSQQSELEEAKRRHQEAKEKFELEQAERNELLKKKEIDLKIYELKEMEKAKLEMEKARNDADIQKTGRLEEITKRFEAACKQIDTLVSSLEKLGVSKDEVAQRPDPSVSLYPDTFYHQTKDLFGDTLDWIREQGTGALSMSWDVIRSGNAYGTRDLIPASRRDGNPNKKGILRIGDRTTLRLISEKAGYLTLFNFGTSGIISKIFPSPEFGTTDNRIVAHHEYTLPGELMPARKGDSGWWTVGGPVSDQNKLPERVIAILTETPVTLSESSFTGETKTTLCRGGFAAVEETISTLADLPPGSWCFGMLEAWIQN
ncbi:MAG: DUF4384 domain-containing protein [Kiritimatiellae bacterium]|nr:DUF4384 domain-containing protein [Kiritimatiellia bacterium]